MSISICSSHSGKRGFKGRRRSAALGVIGFVAALALLSLVLAPQTTVLAQTAGAKVTSVDPGTGKVNDQITVTGTNLGKATVSGVYLSDDKDDFKATIVDQDAGKIVMKVPQVKAGSYNISILVGGATGSLLIQPIHFSVEE
jgi:hypothetical protein